MIERLGKHVEKVTVIQFKAISWHVFLEAQENCENVSIANFRTKNRTSDFPNTNQESGFLVGNDRSTNVKYRASDRLVLGIFICG